MGVGSYLFAVALSAVVATACGKKGPPLAPIVRVPAPIDQIAARRVGNDVYVTLTVPGQNIDASIPADVSRIDVYGYTGRVAPIRALFADLGTRIGSVPVVPPPRPGEPPAPPPDPAAGAVQGTSVTVVDSLDANDLVQGRVAPPLPGRRPPIAPVPVVPQAAMPLRRFYLALPWSPRGRPGPPGAAAELPLTGVPDAPQGVVVTPTNQLVQVEWEPSGGLMGFLLNREIPMEPVPFDEPAITTPVTTTPAPEGPQGPTRYNVYRLLEPDPLAEPGLLQKPAPWRVVQPVPVNPAPLTTFTFSESGDFERTRCYSVRAVRGAAANPTESDASPPVCVRLIDIFPPAPPAAPALVAGEGAISLIWEASIELDLGGYLVLRGEPGDATLQPLTPSPILDTSFRDATVTPGKRYVHAIVAVDNRVPLGNVSAPSERVEETAR